MILRVSTYTHNQFNIFIVIILLSYMPMDCFILCVQCTQNIVDEQ